MANGRLNLSNAGKPAGSHGSGLFGFRWRRRPPRRMGRSGAVSLTVEGWFNQDSAQDLANLFMTGDNSDTQFIGLTPRQLTDGNISSISINQFFLGAAVQHTDPDFDGQIDEFRISTGALVSGSTTAGSGGDRSTRARCPESGCSPSNCWRRQSPVSSSGSPCGHTSGCVDARPSCAKFH